MEFATGTRGVARALDMAVGCAEWMTFRVGEDVSLAWMGNGLWCRVVLDDGEIVTRGAFTADAFELSEAVAASSGQMHCAVEGISLEVNGAHRVAGYIGGPKWPDVSRYFLRVRVNQDWLATGLRRALALGEEHQRERLMLQTGHQARLCALEGRFRHEIGRTHSGLRQGWSFGHEEGACLLKLLEMGPCEFGVCRKLKAFAVVGDGFECLLTRQCRPMRLSIPKCAGRAASDEELLRLGLKTEREFFRDKALIGTDGVHWGRSFLALSS